MMTTPRITTRRCMPREQPTNLGSAPRRHRHVGYEKYRAPLPTRDGDARAEAQHPHNDMLREGDNGRLHPRASQNFGVAMQAAVGMPRAVVQTRAPHALPN